MTNEEAKEFGNKAEDLSRLIDIAIQQVYASMEKREATVRLVLGRR